MQRAAGTRAVGEVRIRSAYMFSGSYRQPELAAQAICDGWFCSGDLGYLVDGHLADEADLIIVGGRNIHPEDLEQVADKVQPVQDARCLAVFPMRCWDQSASSSSARLRPTAMPSGGSRSKRLRRLRDPRGRCDHR